MALALDTTLPKGLETQLDMMAGISSALDAHAALGIDRHARMIEDFALAEQQRMLMLQGLVSGEPLEALFGGQPDPFLKLVDTTALDALAGSQKVLDMVQTALPEPVRPAPVIEPVPFSPPHIQPPPPLVDTELRAPPRSTWPSSRARAASESGASKTPCACSSTRRASTPTRRSRSSAKASP